MQVAYDGHGPEAVLLTAPAGLTEEEVRFIMSIEAPLHPAIKLYGKVCQPRRRTILYALTGVGGYRYSKVTIEARPVPPVLMEILRRVNELTGDKFNSILVNVYAEGDYISAHADDERELGSTGVAMIVCGVTREFRLRDKKTKQRVLAKDGETPLKVLLENNTFAWMKGSQFQRVLTHEVPQDSVKGTRVSLTFRRLEPLAVAPGRY